MNKVKNGNNGIGTAELKAQIEQLRKEVAAIKPHS